MSIRVEVDGLTKFNRNLRALDRDMKNVKRIAIKDPAEAIATKSRRKVAKRSGGHSRSVRAESSGKKAQVVGGGPKAKGFPWLDFGGRVGRRGSVRRSYTRQGRYIYPTYRKMRDSGDIQDGMTDALVDSARQAGLEVKKK